LKRSLAVMTLAFALIAVSTLVLVGPQHSPAAASALPPSHGAVGRDPPLVGLTASYSIVGGGGSQAQDLLSYVSAGSQQILAITGSPATYMVDSGSQWSVQTVLNGSTFNERWITPSQDVSGTISSPLTVSFSYIHQYRYTFNFNVTNGGGGYLGPSVSYSQLGSTVSSNAPGSFWVDAGSGYNYAFLLPGSTGTERWATSTLGSGTVSMQGMARVTYNHQFLISFSYSLVNGGFPVHPTLSSLVGGISDAIPMYQVTQYAWVDGGSPYSFDAQLSGGVTGERWQGTTLLTTQSGSVLSMIHNGTVNSPISITPVYYHQYSVNIAFTFLGGSTSGLTLPGVSYQSFGTKGSVTNNTALWVDAGLQWTRPETICCPSAPTLERWELNNSTTGTYSSPTKVSSTYFHQFVETFVYSIVGQQPPPPPPQPSISYFNLGSAQQLTLTLAPQSAWADAITTYTATSVVSSSTSSQRWFAQAATGSIGGPAPQNSVNVAYTQQYLLTIQGGGIPNQWVNAGTNTTLSTPAVYARSQGAGYRVVSYQIDSGSFVTLPQPVSLLSFQFSMNGPHTIAFSSVRQFQVTLDAGATGALSTITSPTVTGDVYWYDSGSPVQLVLNGGYARAHGVGHRLSSISATAMATIQVNTLAPVQAYSTSGIQSPVSITTTSITQYAVVLNDAALAAFSSISPPSTFKNDTFWYDSGSPAVTVVLNGAFSRSVETGFRVSSWEVDAGAPTKVATTSPIAVLTSPMSSAHFLNTTNVIQYQVTLDKGGAAAVSSITNPPITLDTGWYDRSTPLGLVMNGIWARAAGTGQRLAGYSINGAPQTMVASSGLVVVLNMTKLTSPEAVTASVVTQFQVVLDTSATSALARNAATPIPQDNFWYDGGSPVTVSLNGAWARSPATGTRLISYSVNLGTPTPVQSSAQVQVLSITGISEPQSITTKTGVQYRLSSSPVGWTSVTLPTLPDDIQGWFDAGTAVKAVFNDVWNQTTTSRASVVSYSVDGGTKTSLPRSGTGTFTVAASMTGGHNVALASVTQYLLTVVGPPTVVSNPVSQTADSYFDANSKATLSVPQIWNGTSKPGVRQTVVSYSMDGANPTAVPPSSTAGNFTTPKVTFNVPHTFVFNAVTQYQVAFAFFDSHGKNPVSPSLVELAIGNSTTDVQGTTIWLPNGTSFRVNNVMWEGVGVGPIPPPSFAVAAAPLNVTLDARVYTASLKVTDLLGLPVSGAQVSMTLVNGTTLTGTTNGDGVFAAPMVPLGAFTAKVTNMGVAAQIVGDPASSQPVAQGRLLLSLVSVSVLVAVVAGAGVTGVIVLRRKRRVMKEKK
jgi:hypothetical protein